VLQDFLRRAIEGGQLAEKFLFGQMMDAFPAAGYMRRAAAGDEQMDWSFARVEKPPAELEGNGGAEAVAEQGEGPIQ